MKDKAEDLETEDADDLTGDQRDVLDGNNPKYVKDWDAYNKYKKLICNPILIKRKQYQASDGTIIYMGMLPFQLPKKIEHLDADERDLIHQKVERYRSLMNKANALKNKAFGVVIGRKLQGGTSTLDVKKEEIIELFSKMYKPSEVHEIIVKEWGLSISLDAVYGFRNRWINTITEKMEKYKKEFSDVRLGVKRSRLDELTYLYNLTKKRFEKSPNKGDHEVLLKTLEQVRKEVEGDKLLIEGNIDINVESTINIHMQREVFKSVNINTIILARMGARMGISTEEVIARLLQSHYSKFSGVFGAPKNDMDPNDYPSIIPYDFDRIGSYVQQTNVNTSLMRQGAEQKEVEVTKEVKKLGIREALMAKLQGKQSEVKEKISVTKKMESQLESKRSSLRDKLNKVKKKK